MPDRGMVLISFTSIQQRQQKTKVKDSGSHDLTTCPKGKKQEFVGYFCKNTVDKLLGNPNHTLTLKVK